LRRLGRPGRRRSRELRAPAARRARRRPGSGSEPAARERRRAASRPPPARPRRRALRVGREDSMIPIRALALACALLAALAPAPAAAQGRPVAIKLASFVPEGSIWDKNLRQMGDEWRRATDGRVTLTVFAGGQQGEEATVVS